MKRDNWIEELIKLIENLTVTSAYDKHEIKDKKGLSRDTTLSYIWVDTKIIHCHFNEVNLISLSLPQ